MQVLRLVVAHKTGVQAVAGEQIVVVLTQSADIGPVGFVYSWHHLGYDPGASGSG